LSQIKDNVSSELNAYPLQAKTAGPTVKVLFLLYLLAEMFLVLMFIFMYILNRIPDRLKHFQNIPDEMAILLTIFQFALICYGLRRKSDWLINLIIYPNAYHLIFSFGHATKIIYVVLNGLVFSTSIFQLWFFLKPETRRYFRETSQSLF